MHNLLIYHYGPPHIWYSQSLKEHMRITDILPVPEKRLDIKYANIYRHYMTVNHFGNKQYEAFDFGYYDLDRFFDWYANNIERT